MQRKRNLQGYTPVEMVVTIFIVGLLILLMAVPAGRRVAQKKARIECVNNLKNLGLAVRISAAGNTNFYPGQLLLAGNPAATNLSARTVFRSLANELASPQILHCPADTNRAAASSFQIMTDRSISYFASLTAGETDPSSWLFGDRHLEVDGKRASGLVRLQGGEKLSWGREVHAGIGNIALADGSVQQFTSKRLSTNQTGLRSTNLLVFP